MRDKKIDLLNKMIFINLLKIIRIVINLLSNLILMIETSIIQHLALNKIELKILHKHFKITRT
jgi:hypothetical protein